MIFGPEHQHQRYRRTWLCKPSRIIKACVERGMVEEEDVEAVLEEEMPPPSSLPRETSAEGEEQQEEEGVRGGWDSGNLEEDDGCSASCMN
jgi:hypothetical protein